MRYGSVCSGVEAATVAWHPLGWHPQWFAEVEPFPSAVLNHHYPTVPNLGDMTKLDEKEEFNTKSIDILVGGTPCQAFSVAGLRAGLADERGNLSLEFVRLLTLKRPRWFLWENVPGVLSSSGGADFASILSAWTGTDIAPQKFTKSGIIQGEFYSIAWRILDAQHFGVAQRRRRVFVVGHLGNDWRPPTAVLFERDSLRGNTETGGQKRQETTRETTRGFTASSFGNYAEGVGTLRANGGDLGGGSETLVCYPINTMTCQGRPSDNGRMGLGIGRNGEPQNTLTKAHSHAVAYSVRTANTSSNGWGIQEETTHTLDCAQGPAVAYTIHGTDGTQKIASETETSSCLRARTPGMIENSTTTIAQTNAIARRLTPVECERLQGFPDNYTNIEWKGKEAPTGHRYKAMGNSMAVPVMRWIGERIDRVTKIIQHI